VSEGALKDCVLQWAGSTATVEEAMTLAAAALMKTRVPDKAFAMEVLLTAAITWPSGFDFQHCEPCDIAKVLVAVRADLMNYDAWNGKWVTSYTKGAMKAIMNICDVMVPTYVSTLDVSTATTCILGTVVWICWGLTARGVCCDECRTAPHTDPQCVPGASFATLLAALCRVATSFWADAACTQACKAELENALWPLTSHRCILRHMRGHEDMFNVAARLRFTAIRAVSRDHGRFGLVWDWRRALRRLAAMAPTRAAQRELEIRVRHQWHMAIIVLVNSRCDSHVGVAHLHDYMELFGHPPEVDDDHLRRICAGTTLRRAMLAASRWKPARRLWVQVAGAA
jgi:hypothetical protein